MDGKIGRTNIVPDIRPENIDTYTETNTQEDGTEQTAEYKIVDAHPIIGGVLDKLAFFRTHASAVWYNKMKNITVLQKLDNLASNIGVLAQLATTDKTSLVDAINEINENLNKCVLLFDKNITNTSTEYALNDDVLHYRIIIAIGSKNTDKVIRGYATVPVAALTFFNGVYVQESMPGNITDLISLSFFGNKISTYYRGEMSHLRIYGMF